jgi:hypothetical protein
VPIAKPWLACNDLDTSRVPGTVGVYELGDADGRVIFVGYAGGRSRFGLRGAIGNHRSGEESNPVISERISKVRFEVTTTYLTRYLELLAQFLAEFGTLPEANTGKAESLPPLARFKKA